MLKLVKYVCLFLSILYALISILIILGVIDTGFGIFIIGAVTKVVLPIMDFSLFLNDADSYILTYGIASVLIFVTAVQISYLEKTVRQWGKGESPFNMEYVKGMRSLSIGMCIVMIFFQPILVLFGIVLFVFSYLMEYDNALEYSAKMTIGNVAE